MFTVEQNHKSSQLLPVGQVSDTQARAGFFTEEQDFVWTNKRNLLPPLLLPPLNPIVCHHVSPTRLFLSYRQRQLPIPLNCLLCKVTAEEWRWERAVLAFSWSSVSATLLTRDSTRELYCMPWGNYTVVLTCSDTWVSNLGTCFIRKKYDSNVSRHFKKNKMFSI